MRKIIEKNSDCDWEAENVIEDLREVNDNTIKMIINQVKKQLKIEYLFPEKVEELNFALDSDYAKNVYARIQDPEELVKSLTKTLQGVVQDKHLRVQLPSEVHNASKSKRPLRGIEKVEILQGNIGYIFIESFLPLSLSENTLLGSMQFIRDTRALILDLRKCRGGSGDSANLLLSYLFPQNNRLLLKIYFRPTDSDIQVWTSWTPFKYENPIYVLISNYTFSAGEHFAFALKINKQSTLIGEHTGGGAHPVSISFHDVGVAITVPIGRTYDPKTGDDWEGVGVIPDIDCKEDKALEMALTHIKENVPEQQQQ
ncbi:MAG: S41 family peptidase [Candidatus Hodarchaeota archaeon]